MSSLITSCPICGRALDSFSEPGCPHCSPIAEVPQPVSKQPPWGLAMALLAWAASVVLLILVPLVALLGYLIGFNQPLLQDMFRGRPPSPTALMEPNLVLTTIVATFIAHLLTLALCWLIVTGMGKRPFFATLGWGWHKKFKWWHALLLALGMLALGEGLARLLPHGKTDLDKMLSVSASVRVAVALLAVLTAPLIEEVVYRGVLYSALERAGGQITGIIIVALLFGAVHVPQYWGSKAVLAAVMCLSLALTVLRATTGKLLPCVMTHLFFNGIQAIFILARPPKPPLPEPVQATIFAALQYFMSG